MIVRLQNNCIELPEEILKQASLKEGAPFDCVYFNNTIYLVPILPLPDSLTPLATTTNPTPIFPIQICLFSQLQLSVMGKPYSIKNKKARELLSMLLIRKGNPVKKLWIAETLWPLAEQPQALDSLYKVIRFWKSDEVLHTYFPLKSRSNELELELKQEQISCDIWDFEKYIALEEIKQMEAAVNLYSGPFLFQEYYEWTAEYEAYYEIKFMKLLDCLIYHFEKEGNQTNSFYYRKKRDKL